MQREEFIRVLFAAAAFLKSPLEALASQSLKDAYVTAKACLARKLGLGSSAHRALESALQQPEPGSVSPPALPADWTMDDTLSHLGEALAAQLLAATGHQQVRVSGRSHRVQVAGRDLITTIRVVRRNVLTPGEGHLTAAQRRQLVVLIAEVADRFAGEDGRPRFGAVHAMLQQRFGVLSYLTIPNERFVEAVCFLKRQRAISRSRLRRRNPAAYAQDLLRIIHARRVTLGWLKPQVYAFGTEKLGLTNPVTSLKALDPVQLRALAEKSSARMLTDSEKILVSRLTSTWYCP